VRLKNIHLGNALKKLESTIRNKEQLAGGSQETWVVRGQHHRASGRRIKAACSCRLCPARLALHTTVWTVSFQDHLLWPAAGTAMDASMPCVCDATHGITATKGLGVSMQRACTSLTLSS